MPSISETGQQPVQVGILRVYFAVHLIIVYSAREVDRLPGTVALLLPPSLFASGSIRCGVVDYRSGANVIAYVSLVNLIILLFSPMPVFRSRSRMRATLLTRVGCL